jgi:hypothetical protein
VESVELGRHGVDGWERFRYGRRSVLDLDGVQLDLADVFGEVHETRVTE